MARFYADENFDYRVVKRLRALGYDVLTVQEAGEQGHDDPHVLAFASQAGRTVLTHDRRDFARLHRANSVHGGIVSCTFDPDADALAERIHQTVTTTPALTGQHVRINLPGGMCKP